MIFLGIMQIIIIIQEVKNLIAQFIKIGLKILASNLFNKISLFFDNVQVKNQKLYIIMKKLL